MANLKIKIKKGDQVQIVAGKDRGKQGKVLRTFPERERIMVEGLNLRIKHVRPKRSGEKGQRLEVPAAFNISNVMLLCPKCGKATRIGYRIEGEKKARTCKRCQAEI